MFKVGDKVERVNCNYHDVIKGGKYTISELVSGVAVRLEGCSYCYSLERFRLVSPKTPSVTPSVTRDNPLVSVWVEGSMYVVIHRGMVDKLANCKGRKKFCKEWEVLNEDGVMEYQHSVNRDPNTLVYLLGVPSTISRLVNLLKDVRNAKWQGKKVQVTATSIKL